MITKPAVSLDLIDVASPCPAEWGKMSGDDRMRFCRQCNLHVYNLSEMSRAEAEAFVTKSEGRTCVRFYRRTDGTILTRDCPVGLRAVRQRLVRAAAALAGMVVALVTGTLFGSRLKNASIPNLQRPSTTYAEWVEPGSTSPPVLGKMIMGNMICPPPVLVPVNPTGIVPLEPAESPLPQPTPEQLEQIQERLK